jgi:hypothetical protein
MDWKQLLGYITGSVDQELLLRNEYLITENRILRQQIPGRVRLGDEERKRLAEIGQKLVILMPPTHHCERPDVSVHCRKRLGGLLKYYHGEAA